MPESRQVDTTAGDSNAPRCSVDFQTRTQIFDLPGGVPPQSDVWVARYNDVL
jgi:hypothetical protein